MPYAYNKCKESKEFIVFGTGYFMELAKITSKGQITISIDIRRKLGIKNGDKVLFIEEVGRIYITNSFVNALADSQAIFAGSAKHTGLANGRD